MKIQHMLFVPFIEEVNDFFLVLFLHCQIVLSSSPSNFGKRQTRYRSSLHISGVNWVHIRPVGSSSQVTGIVPVCSSKALATLGCAI